MMRQITILQKHKVLGALRRLIIYYSPISDVRKKSEPRTLFSKMALHEKKCRRFIVELGWNCLFRLFRPSVCQIISIEGEAHIWLQSRVGQHRKRCSVSFETLGTLEIITTFKTITLGPDILICLFYFPFPNIKTNWLGKSILSHLSFNVASDLHFVSYKFSELKIHSKNLRAMVQHWSRRSINVISFQFRHKCENAS